MTLLADSLTLFKREMLIFFANIRTNVIRSIIFPFVIIVFFGNIGSLPSNVPISVVNLANNPQSTAFIQQLSASSTLQIISVTSEATALSLLQSQTVAIVVVILPTFPSSDPNTAGVQVYYSNTQQSLSEVGVPVVNQIAAKFSQKVNSVLSNAPSAPATSPNGEVSATAIYGTTSSYKTFLAGGVIPMVVIFGALFGGGMSIISDRQMGNLKAFFITPINKDAIVVSRIFSGAVQGLVFALCALLVGLLDGANITMFWPLALLYIAAVVILISASFCGIAILLASKINRVDAFAIFSQAVNLPLWFISGGIVPVQSLPSWLQAFAAFDPLTYANNIVRDVMIQGSISVSATVLNFSILIAFTLVCVFLALKVFERSSGVET